MFAIIKVDQNYDCIEGVECVTTFPTEQEAVKYILSRQLQQQQVWQTREKYISEYVDKFPDPPTDNVAWRKFVEPFYQHSVWVTPNNFKNHLKSSLRQHPYASFPVEKLKDYNPPAYESAGDLYVVEIK